MIKKSLFFIVLILLCIQSFAGIFDPVKNLAKRRVAWLEPYLLFQKIKTGTNNNEVFELFSKGNKIVIAASDVNAAAEGLNWYLNYYCHRSMSHLGDNLSPVYPLPVIKKEVHVESPFKYRYALNYCTLNYTMSFYNWKDWQWELDWMALHGVNLMLMPIGTEEVWEYTLKKFGFSNQEIKNFIPGPAYNAWWLMGNLEGWGGPVTQQMIDRRTKLEQKILARMHKLGIQPVLQGFYGMVPGVLKKYFPHADIRPQGKWAGGFNRPAYLLPDDSLFHRMAKVYYGEIKRLYGSDIHFFGGDPFHEGGSTKGVDLPRAGMLIQSNMQEVFPNSTWVLQGWQDNPSKEMLEGLNKADVLVLELAGEKSDAWKTRKGFNHTPFIWCTANNFGGKSGLYGKLQFFANEIYAIQHGPYKSLCKGIGIMPEGIHNNPVDYDLMLYLGWQSQKINVNNWIKKYVKYRYGVNNDTIQLAWQIFLQTVYRNIPGKEAGLPEDVFCARPAWNLHSVSTWGTMKRNYDTALFARGVKLFLLVFPHLCQDQTYLIDAIDFSRQVLANDGQSIYQEMESAFNKKNIAAFKKSSSEFKRLISLDDSLLSLNKNFRLNTWLSAAINLGKTPYERNLFEKNARMQITYWGPDDTKTNLHDYANREWSGLLRSFYLPRWKMFIHQSLLQMEGKPTKPVNYFKFGEEWANKKKLVTPLHLTQYQEIEMVSRVNSIL